MSIRICFYPLFILVILFPITVYADSWPAPTEKDYFSKNKNFIAHITPVKGNKPLLEVFEVENKQRVLLWQCKLSNKVAPVEVFISDDGRCVVTNNEWHQIGYGDCVIAFYSKNGLIKKYTMEKILHLPDDITQGELFQLTPHSVSSRYWDKKSIKFFDTYVGESYFCIWLGLFDMWQAWSTEDGNEIKINEKMLEQWNNKGRLWALEKLNTRGHDNSPYEFLGKLKHPEDRYIIESLLKDDSFTSHKKKTRFLRKENIGTKDEHSVHELLCYTEFSSNRALGDRILAEWEGKTPKKSDSSEQQYYYLGKAKGMVKLPRPPKSGKPEVYHEKDGVFCVYLIPSTISKTKWNEGKIVHRLAVSFDRYSFNHCELTENFPFSIEGVTPGKYWVKAVWGKAKPFNFYSGTSLGVGAPHKGDYESLESPMIDVKAGETVDKIVIDCTHQVVETKEKPAVQVKGEKQGIILTTDFDLAPQVIKSWGRQKEFFVKNNFEIISWEKAKDILLRNKIRGGKQYHTGWLTIYTENDRKYLVKQPQMDALWDFMKEEKIKLEGFGTE